MGVDGRLQVVTVLPEKPMAGSFVQTSCQHSMERSYVLRNGHSLRGRRPHGLLAIAMK